MKFTSVLCLLLVALLTMSGCKARDQINDLTENSQEGLIESMEKEDSQWESDPTAEAGFDRIQEDARKATEHDVSWDKDDRSDMEPSEVEDEIKDAESSDAETAAMEGQESENESTTAMSIDVTEVKEEVTDEAEKEETKEEVNISELNGEMKPWGSGGPKDESGRPNGALAYQELYGKYNAYFITPSSQNIYLTFDEGYENGYTPKILDTLKEKNVKAVFFITLDFAQRQPELVQRMIDEGHIIGNHSCKHKSFPGMSLEDLEEDIMTLHNYIKDNFYYEMHLIRPPMGEFSEQTLALTQSLGYKSVFWSFAYQDYDVDNQPNIIESLDHVVQSCHPGAVILLHAVSRTNEEILGDAIDQIQAKGYTFARWDW